MRISAWLFWGQQMLCTACLLMALGRGLGLPVRLTWRFWACAAAGASAVLVTAITGARLLQLLLIGPLMLLPFLAFPRSLRENPRRLPSATVLLLLSALGISRLLSRLGLSGTAMLMMTCIAVLIVLPALLPASAGPRHVRLKVLLDGHAADLDGLVDSGNLVTDPVTQLPVIVLSPEAAARLAFEPLALRPGVRLMRTRTASGSMLLTLLRPDQVLLAGKPVSAMIGVVPQGPAAFEALVPERLAAGQPIPPPNCDLTE